MRSSPILIVAMATTLAGCASAGGSAPPVCDGKHRRPVNLHGSVLAPVAATAPAPADPAASAPAFPSCGQ